MTILNYILFIYIFFVGILFGSFLNVVIYRTHSEEPWWFGRSHCPYCQKNLTWKELIPILSYILQKGKCRKCKATLSVQYPVIELLSGIILAYLYYTYGFNGQFLILSLIGIFLLGSFVTDLLYMELYEIFMIPSILLAVFYQLIYKDVNLQNFLIGITFGIGFFLVQYLITKGKGIGAGDIRLGAIIGALLGWPLVLASIAISYICGSIVAIFLLILGKANRKTSIPLGIFLIPGLIITFIFKPEIHRYLESYFSSLVYLF